MTTRRRLLAIAGGAAIGGGAAVLGGCRARPVPVAAPVAVPDVLLVDTTKGLAVVRGTRCEVAGTGVAAADVRTIYATVPMAGGATRLNAIRTSDGTVAASVRLDGAWVPRIASPDGTSVAMMAPARSAGRARTSMLITDRTGPGKRLDLPGNVEPDAFGRGAGNTLFVLDWLPPAAPDRYRVRAVDLTTGTAGPLLTRNKVPVPAGAEEEMHGTARQAVYAPDLSTVYTLYTNQPEHQHTRDLLAGKPGAELPAFVHTLSLEVGWAYCVDLPLPFGRGDPAAHTAAITPDGTALLVADLSSGRLAHINTQELTVTAVATLPTGTGRASAAASPYGDRLYVGIGTRVHLVALPTMDVKASWEMPAAVRGLAASKDGSRLLIGYPGGVAWLDAATGRSLGRAAVTGLTEVRCAV
jgi:hypothetical protein